MIFTTNRNMNACGENFYHHHYVFCQIIQKMLQFCKLKVGFFLWWYRKKAVLLFWLFCAGYCGLSRQDAVRWFAIFSFFFLQYKLSPFLFPQHRLAPDEIDQYVVTGTKHTVNNQYNLLAFCYFSGFVLSNILVIIVILAKSLIFVKFCF